MLRNLKDTYDISSSFHRIPICVSFQNFYTFLNQPSCALMTGVNTSNSIYFLLNWKIFGICILCIKIFHGIEYPDKSWYKSCFLVDFNGVNRWYIQNVGILDKHGIWCESLVWVIMGWRGVSQNANVLVVLVMILLSYLIGFSYIVQPSLKLYELCDDRQWQCCTHHST